MTLQKETPRRDSNLCLLSNGVKVHGAKEKGDRMPFSKRDVNFLRESLGYEKALEMLAVRVDKLNKNNQIVHDAYAERIENLEVYCADVKKAVELIHERLVTLEKEIET